MFAKNLLVALVASFVAVSVAAPTPEAAPDAVEKREVETPVYYYRKTYDNVDKREVETPVYYYRKTYDSVAAPVEKREVETPVYYKREVDTPVYYYRKTYDSVAQEDTVAA